MGVYIKRPFKNSTNSTNLHPCPHHKQHGACEAREDHALAHETHVQHDLLGHALPAAWLDLVEASLEQVSTPMACTHARQE